MKKQLLLILITLISLSCNRAVTTKIALNSLGFLPNNIKKASVVVDQSQTFVIKEFYSDSVVFEGKTSAPKIQNDVAESVAVADFSGLTATGEFYLETADKKTSSKFSISDHVYNDAFHTVMQAMYLWRCGTAVDGECNGVKYHQNACHLNDGCLDYIDGNGEVKNGVGGWHDAGDYGKYTVNAAVSLGVMFLAWDHFNNQLIDYSYDLPTVDTIFPQYLQELKYEIDWLLSMQYSDNSGRVSHKLTRLNFSAFIMPDKDTVQRYFSEWGSAATADFVAVMAMGARYFKPFDEAYALKCLKAAKVSYAFLTQHPEYKRFEQGDFSTGGYQTEDDDDRLWAAAEMWETTGDSICLVDFESRFLKLDHKVLDNWDWSDVGNLGVFTYALSSRQGRNKETLTDAIIEIVKVADSIVEESQFDVYERPMGSKYFWGCNGAVARQAVNLKVAELLSGVDKYRATRLNIIAHLFGRNYYGRSYVTCLGIEPPQFPHDRRSGADNVEAPWPGYLVGGGQTATDWVDEQGSYSHNEIAINWQSALIYSMAEFIQVK